MACLAGSKVNIQQWQWRVLHISQISSIIEVSLSDCLVSYIQDTRWGRSYPSAEMQLTGLDKDVPTFPKNISSKVDVVTQLEFKPSYSNTGVQHVSHNAKETTHLHFKVS